MQRGKWIIVSILLLGGLAACPPQPVKIPTLTAQVGRPPFETQGAIVLTGENFAPNTTYSVGIFAKAAPTPEIIGTIQSDNNG